MTFSKGITNFMNPLNIYIYNIYIYIYIYIYRERERERERWVQVTPSVTSKVLHLF